MENSRYKIMGALSVLFLSFAIILFINIQRTENPSHHRIFESWRTWKQDIRWDPPQSWWELEPIQRVWETFDIHSSPLRIVKPHILSLQLRFPKTNGKEDAGDKKYLYVSGIYGQFLFSYQGEAVYDFGWNTRREENKFFFGYPWHIIPIPSSAESMDLDIFSDQKFIGPFGNVYIGSLASIFWYIISESWDRLILGLFFLLMGFFSLLFLFDRTIRTSFVIFGMFCIAIGIYTITRSPIRLFYYDNHSIWTWLNLISVYSIPTILFLFLNRFFMMGKWHILYYASIVHFSFLVYALFFSILGVEFLLNTLPYFQGLIFITGILSLVQILITTYIQRRTNQLIILAGFSIFLIFGLHESLIAMGFIMFQYTNVYWGMLVLIMSMAFVLVRKFTDMNDQLESSNKSLKRLFQIQEELESAKKIQLSLFPQVFPRSDMWDIQGHYSPMDKVGGDFYDILQKDEHSVGIFLSDVSGHGLSTALLASMVKVAFAQQLSIIDRPSAILTELNRILVGKCGKQFITACYIYLDWNTMTYKFSHAAHPSIIHYSPKQDRVRHRRTRGRIMGVWEDIIYKEEEYSFEEGDIFLVYSDGILEVGNQHDQFPKEEYLDLILSNKAEYTDTNKWDRELKTIEERIMSYLVEWRGSNYFEDDISFVLIQAKLRDENKLIGKGE